MIELIELILLMIITGILVYIFLIMWHNFPFRSPRKNGNIIIDEIDRRCNELERGDIEDNIDERGEFDKERQKAIEDLRQFALDKIDKENNKVKGSPGEILMNGQGSGPVTSGKEYIPYHLTEQEKNILRQFNS